MAHCLEITLGRAPSRARDDLICVHGKHFTDCTISPAFVLLLFDLTWFLESHCGAQELSPVLRLGTT